MSATTTRRTHHSAVAGAEAVWDLLVVGGGTAGLVAAKTAARFGARVLMVERGRTGGDCLWTGCVPSKSLIASAAASGGALHGRDLPAVAGRWRGAMTAIEPKDSVASIEATGAHVVRGSLVFTGPSTAEVDETPLTFRQAVIATGSEPVVPGAGEVPGLERSGALTSETLWDHLEGLAHLPERLVVLGGGPVGCELGQALARLGSGVTLVQSGPRLLAREDPDASALVRAALERDGVHVRTGSRAASAEPAPGGGGTLVLDDGTRLPYDRVLVASGRSPRTAGLGLEAAGVELDERGYVRVDTHLRTSNPRIWAAGDVSGNAPFTHLAGVHGSLAASNAVLGLTRAADPVVPRVTFTSPEVAAVGVPSGPGLAKGLRTVTVDHEHLDRAITAGDRGGLTRLVLDRRSRVVGATIVGPRAGESLAEVTLAIRLALRARDLAATVHPYPTYGDGVYEAAVFDVAASLRSAPATLATRLLVRVRRVRLDLRRGTR